jgi:hypothetical protein
MHADAEVMHDYGGPIGKSESDAKLDQSGAFLGYGGVALRAEISRPRVGKLLRRCLGLTVTFRCRRPPINCRSPLFPSRQVMVLPCPALLPYDSPNPPHGGRGSFLATFG